MLEFSEEELTMSNWNKIGGVDPRLISHSHYLDKFTFKGNLKIGFGGINTFAISKDHRSSVWTKN